MSSNNGNISGGPLARQVAVVTGAGSATGIGSYLTAQLLVIDGGNCVIDDKAHHP